VALVWPAGAALKQWLQVIVKANANTGLVAPDVFYFGNAVGESGNVVSDYSVSLSDELLARNNPVSIVPGTMITNYFDFNRDGTVSVIDQLLSRNNITTAASKLKQITVPSLLSSVGLVPQGLDDAVDDDLARSLTQWRAHESDALAARSTDGALTPSYERIRLHPETTIWDSRATVDYPSLHRRGNAVEVDDELLELLHAAR
jgi:hypothetical protein